MRCSFSKSIHDLNIALVVFIAAFNFIFSEIWGLTNDFFLGIITIGTMNLSFGLYDSMANF